MSFKSKANYLIAIFLSIVFSGCVTKVEKPVYKTVQGKTELYPTPKEFKIEKEAFNLSNNPIIIIGKNADKVERFAAERFQTLVQRKTGVTLPVRSENTAFLKQGSAFILGKRSTNSWLDRLCTEHKINLSDTMPNGFEPKLSDGFVLQTITESNRNFVIIGGSNSRGVIYGQESCADLLSFDGENFSIPQVAVRDWPTVKWRKDGAWIKDIHKFYFERIGIEALIRARINLIPFRPRRNPSFLTKLFNEDAENREMADELHRRGFMLSVGVHGAIDKHQHDSELKKLRRNLELGGDQVYVGFDDAGMGEAPLELIEKVVKLSAKYGIKDDHFAVTTLPYAELPENNPKIAKVLSVKGFEKAVVIITRPPDKELHRQCTERKINYQFWHNWPMGFQYSPVLRKNALHREVYHIPVPFNVGWFEPTDDTMRLGENYTPNSMFSLAGSRGVAENFVYTWGMYAWNPGGLNWEKTEDAIFSYIFGDSSVSKIRKINKILIEVSPLFNKEEGHGGWRKVTYRSPLSLIDTADKSKVLKKLRKAQRLYTKVKENALKESLVPQARLYHYFLNPLQDSINVYEKCASLSWPEEFFVESELMIELSKLLEKNNEKGAAQLLETKLQAVRPLLKEIENELGDFYQISVYLNKWEEKQQLSYWVDKINQQKSGNVVLYISRSKDGMVKIEPELNEDRFMIFYSIDGSEPRAFTKCYAYKNPFELKGEGIVKAVIFDTKQGIHGHVFAREFGYTKGNWSIAVDDNQKQSDVLIDDNLYNYWVNNGHFDIWNVDKTENKTSSSHPHNFIVDLGEEKTVGGIGYMPGLRNFRNKVDESALVSSKPAQQDAFTFLWGAAEDYKVFVSQDGKSWGEAVNSGNFDYPKGLGVGTRRYKPYHVFVEKMYQRVNFDKTYKARYIKFVVESIYDKQIPVTSMNEIDIFSN